MTTKTGNDLFIVDNSDDEWRVLNYLAEWSEISSRFDIATGYLEIGALHALRGKWQMLDPTRVLMGDEVAKHIQLKWSKAWALPKGFSMSAVGVRIQKRLPNEYRLAAVPPAKCSELTRGE